MGQVSSDVVLNVAVVAPVASFQTSPVLTALLALGYSPSLTNRNIVRISDTIEGKEYPIVFDISEELQTLSITCQVGDLNNVGDNIEKQRDFLFACVNMNDRTIPFATSIITTEDDSSIDEESVPVVLVGCFPLVSKEELFYHTNGADGMSARKNAISSYLDLLRKSVMFYNNQTSICNF